MTGYSPALPPEVWMDHVVIDQRRVAEAYLRGELEQHESETFARHLEHCEECGDRVTLAQLWLLSRNARLATPVEKLPEFRKPNLARSQATANEAVQAGRKSTDAPAPGENTNLGAPVTEETPLAGETRKTDEPLVTRVAVRPDEDVPAAGPNFGEMLAKRLEMRNSVPEPLADALRSTPTAADVVAESVVEALGQGVAENLTATAEGPSLRSQFATWQLVILGVLLGLLLMAIPAAYFWAQVRRQGP